MSSAKRRINRLRKKEMEKDLREKVSLFNEISDCCNMCEGPFDKKNEEQVKSWRVVVRKQEKKVNLYCPACWDYANEFLEDVRENLEKNEDV